MEFKLPINKYKNTDSYLGFPLYVLTEFQEAVTSAPYTSRDYKLYTTVLTNNEEYGIPVGAPSILRDQYCSYMEPPELGVMLYPSTLNCTFIFMMNLKEFSYNQIMFYEATEERKTEAVQAVYQGKPLDQKGDSSDEISSTLTKDINAFHYPFDFYDLPTKFEVEMIEILRNRLKATVVDYDNFGNEITAYDQIEVIMIVDPSVTPIVGEAPVLIPKPIVIDFQEIRESNATETLQHLYLDTQNINYWNINAEQYLNSLSNYELKYGNFGTTIESKLNEIITKYFNGDLDEELNQLDILRDSILVDEVETGEVWPTNTIVNNAINAFPNLINDLGASVHSNLYWNNI